MGNHTPTFDTPKKIVVITAPSGAGKSTLVKKLMKQLSQFSFSVSCTTRPVREGEENGKNYYYISAEEFNNKIKNNEFVEYQEVYPGQFYGTLKSEVGRIWDSRKIALFDIDVKGAENIKKEYGKDALVVFIAPPDKESLFTRLKNRNTENASSLKKRIAKATEELSYQAKADKVVVNADFDIAFMNLKNIIANFLKH